MDDVPGIVRIVSPELRRDMGELDLARAVTESACEVVLRIQDELERGVLTVTLVVVLDSDGEAGDRIGAILAEVARGIAQSVQVEIGTEGVRCNVIVCNESQSADAQRTVDFIVGGDGGFMAGATVDLLEGVR
jgi:hypothetical protein